MKVKNDLLVSTTLFRRSTTIILINKYGAYKFAMEYDGKKTFSYASVCIYREILNNIWILDYKYIHTIT